MMKKRWSRYSSWEDRKITEAIINRAPGTKMYQVFEQLSKELGRSQVSIQYRWSEYLSKKVNKEKRTGKVVKSISNKERVVFDNTPNVGSQEVSDFIKNATTILNNHIKLKEENQRLVQELEDYQKQVKELKSKLETIEDDYNAMLSLLEKARKLTLAEEESKIGLHNNTAKKFKMDRNGNLQPMK